MNLCTTNAAGYDVAIGDSVEIIATTRSSLNTLMHASKLSGMIPYELLVKFASNVKRKII